MARSAVRAIAATTLALVAFAANSLLCRAALGAGEVKIMGLELLNDKEEQVDYPQSGRELVIRLHYQTDSDAEFRNGQLALVTDPSGAILALKQWAE